MSLSLYFKFIQTTATKLVLLQMVGRSPIVAAAGGVLGTGRAGVPLVVAGAVILFPRIVTGRASASILG